MRIVVDASVALKWFLSPVSEPDADMSKAVLLAIQSKNLEAVAPPHWLAEVLGVLARSAPDRISNALEIVYGLDVVVVSDRHTHERAANLAVQLNHHLFDTLYHAVAFEMDATLITADEVYFCKAQGLGRIQRLSTFAVAPS